MIAQGIDSQGILNGRVLTSDIQNVITLDMQNLGISSLSGIENFTALQTLNVNNNSIVSL
ncbi:MAG TPA: Por secretion system protein, partial [Maribacter sp.]|nr:Por secretion system protein [Maribacter sp.]